MIALKVIYILLFVFIANYICAQSIADSTFILKEVEVKAKKQLKEKAIIKTNIDTSLIQESLDASLSNLLSKHSPVFIKTYGQGALATVSFRGTAASHTQVEWNGMNINSPMLGQVDFSLIPVYFIDQVELLHGGSSLQFGSGALGGSVQVNSEPIWDTIFKTTFIQTAGSYATYQSFVKLSAGKNKFCYDIRLYHEQSENDFLFYNNATGLWNYERQQNADYQKNGALLNTWYHFNNNNSISLNLWGQLTDRNLPPVMSYQGSGRNEKQQDKELRMTGKWKKYGKNYKSELTTGYTKTSLDYYLANETPLGLFVNYDSKSNIKSCYHKYMFERSFGNKTLFTALLNYNYHIATIFDHKELTGYDATRYETGASISVHHGFSERISAYCLLRDDYVDNDFTPLMPSVGIEYQAIKKTPLIIRSNFTGNYHQPTLNDLYWLPGGNSELRPEQGYTGDIAVEYKMGKDSMIRFSTSIGSYFSHITDWIIWRPGEFRYWQADNIKQVYARGIEYSLSATGTGIKFKWGIHSNYTYTKTTNEEETLPGDNSVGKQLIYIPVHKANIMLDLGYRKFVFHYSTVYTGERFTTSSNEPTRHTLQAYILHDVLLGKQFGLFKNKAEIQFKINNLFNINYQAILWRAMPGRNYKILIKFQL